MKRPTRKIKRPAPPADGGRPGVVKLAVWDAVCLRHGLQRHLAYLGGRCCVCQHEGLVAKGLVRP